MWNFSGSTGGGAASIAGCRSLGVWKRDWDFATGRPAFTLFLQDWGEETPERRRRIMLMVSRLVLAALLIGAGHLPASLAAAPSEAVVLAPHRAIYEIALATARSGAGVSELSGRMVYELTGSPCDGYTQNMRFVTRMTNQEGSASVSDLRSSSWEDGAGQRLRFESSHYRDQQLAEQAAGTASRGATSGEVKAELTKPTKQQLSLPAGVLFPVQHSIKMIEAARAGRTAFAADLYDGSEKGDKVYATNAFIGRRLAPGFSKTLPPVKNGEKLASLPAWPVSLGYYEDTNDRSDALPSYELAFVLFDNGVSHRIFIDYGEFAIRGQLTDLEFLNPGTCDAGRR
jgi:EipB-like